LDDLTRNCKEVIGLPVPKWKSAGWKKRRRRSGLECRSSHLGSRFKSKGSAVAEPQAWAYLVGEEEI
jgi:hypothetical protein